jgi:hypothetical protein
MSDCKPQGITALNPEQDRPISDIEAELRRLMQVVRYQRTLNARHRQAIAVARGARPRAASAPS